MAWSSARVDDVSCVILPVDPQWYIGSPNDQVQRRLRQVNVVRGELHRRSRQMEPVLGPALVTNGPQRNPPPMAANRADHPRRNPLPNRISCLPLPRTLARPRGQTAFDADKGRFFEFHAFLDHASQPILNVGSTVQLR